LLSRALGTVVGHGRGLDHDGRFGQQFQYNLAHLLGGFDSRNFGTATGVRAVGPLTSQHAGAAPQRGFGQCVSMRPLERLVR